MIKNKSYYTRQKITVTIEGEIRSTKEDGTREEKSISLYNEKRISLYNRITKLYKVEKG